jgi:outer membrane autotransporter protein
MNNPVRQNGARSARRYATSKISPMTRAIRDAMAVSVAVLALSSGSMAHAGVRHPGAIHGASHSGAAFFAPAPDIAPADLTRIHGDDPPRSVVASAAKDGIAFDPHAESLTAIDNGGDRDISGYGSVIALYALDDVVTIDNSAAIIAAATPAYAGGYAEAIGVEAIGDEVEIENANGGYIGATAASVGGTAFAMGMYGAATQTTTLRNYGDVAVSAGSVYGDAIAYGAFEYAGGAGIGLAINDGDIQAEASAGSGARADATGVNVVGDVASIFNDGSIGVVATAGDGGLADARAARSYGSYTNVSNYGSLSAEASADGGVATARGADSLGFLGAYVYNAGDIHSTATADGGTASAFGSYSVGIQYGGYTTNVGTIAAQATGDSASAYGALNASAYYGDAITTNAGSISATAVGGMAEYGETEAVAIGAYNFALVYDSVVDNSGSISATAVAMADISGTYGFLQAKAVGAEAVDVYGYGDAVIDNTGAINAVAMASQGYASAWGAVVQSSGQFYGAANIDNDGAISAYAHSGIGIATATGAYANDLSSDAGIVNHGDINASARVERGIPYVTVDYSYATGLKAGSYYGNATIANYGNINAGAYGNGAITGARGIQASGVYVSITNGESGNINATGEVDLFGGGFATGIDAAGIYGIDVVNDGDIAAYGHAHAYSQGDHGYYGAAKAIGIYASAGFQGDVSIENNGDVTAFANAEDSVSFFQGGAGATGINAYAKYDATIVNAGDITAIGQSELGIVGTYGATVHGKYSSSLVNRAGANIVSSATVGSLASDAYGGRAVSFGVHMFGNGMDHGEVYNAGSIVSHATVVSESANTNPSIASAWGAAVGAYSNIQSGTIVNQGDIEATASAEFGYATAYGSYILAGTSAVTSNDGSIFASADAANGNAWSVGSFGRSVEQYQYVPCEVVDGPYGPYNSCDYSEARWIVTGGDASLDNSGDIASIAHATDGVGRSYGAVTLGGYDASIVNAGRIDAVAEADDALAVGALANAFYGEGTVDNSGAISAVASGDSAEAKGVYVIGASGAEVDNSGTIMAGAYGADATATAVAMDSQGNNVLVNDGTIGAFGDGIRNAVWSGVDATADITNNGSMIGAVVTGDFDDYLDNAAGGQWLAVGSSDFGAGDDHVVNHGTLLMDNATIRMGDYVDGNTFDNFGTLAVSGAGNVIDMGNPFPVDNEGVISFIDGTPDDVLAVVGDFGGQGTIDFDVSGLNQTGDRLYVDGDVADASVQTLNVNLIDLPTRPASDIPLATVAGDSAAGDFVLGKVAYTPNFLTWDFQLNSHIDAAGSGDVFSLGIDATGLSGGGILAASVASGTAGMLDAQIGTFKQRMGVNPFGDPGKVLSTFFRTYASEGDVDPTHVASNFGQGGDFTYHQNVTGNEVGINANLSANFHAGMTLGHADGRQHPIAADIGSNRMDGMTLGAYASWFSPRGYYFDLSGRWMAVDVVSASSAGALKTRVHAGAWNLEAGYQWNLRGLSIVPQLQYTRTEVEDVRAMQLGGSSFQAQGGTSSRVRLGVEVGKTFDTGDIRWTPYGSINAIREFDGDFAFSVDDAFAGTTRTGGTSAMAELGLGMQARGWGLTVGAHWTDGGATRDSIGGHALLRFAW